MSEIRSNVADTTREDAISSLIDAYINLTLQEINDPAWATGGYNHLWSFNRRKNTLSISAETAQLPRDLDKIGLIRQTNSPTKLAYVPDEIFYRFIPNPTATGNPLYYRVWEEEGISTRLTANGTIDAVSSSNADGSAFTVSVVGKDANGIIQSEVLTLSGTSKVTGSTTFATGYPIRISKSGKTTGSITITTGSTTLLVLGPEERTARFKVIGVYPIVTSATNLYLEYYTRIRNLVNNTDVPDIDEKWLWVVRQGSLAKVYQYQNKPGDFLIAQQTLYKNGVEAMVKADMQENDYIPYLRRHGYQQTGVITFSDLGYGSYGLNF